MTIVKPESVKNPAVSIHKILVAVDLSEHSKLTIAYAAQIAKCFDASVMLVHVFTPEALYEFPNEYSYELVEKQRRDYEIRLAELTDVIQEMDVACESAFLIGEPAERVGALARDTGVDLIITASHHPKFLARLFNLDKAPQIMHRAPCPVLVFHERNA
jgi:nucleotide-binding universal stress UspA family protein